MSSSPKDVISFDVTVDEQGMIQIPAEHREFYGQRVQLLLLKEHETETLEKVCDPMEFSGTINWPMSGLEHQKLLRAEW